MIIKRKFNNNVILSEDNNHTEVVLIGKALAFGKKIGEKIDESQIDKKYVLDQQAVSASFNTLLGEIPPQNFFLASKIIEEAEQTLKTSFNSLLFISLVDHLSYALERSRHGKTLKNAMLWEIRRFYPKEYACAKQSLKIIHHYENIWLSDDEAGYIALHFVNAEQGTEMQDTILMTEIVQYAVKIIRYHFQIVLDENSLNYIRLITHLRYFVLRAMKKEEQTDVTQGELLPFLTAQYPEIWDCVRKISVYFEKELHVRCSDDEYTFLMLHVIRVVKKDIMERQRSCDISE